MQNLKIGDIVALPADVDHAVALDWARQQKQYRAKVKSGYDSPSTRAAKIAISATENALERLRDPLEQAKTYLRSKGWIPVATMAREDGGGHRVGRHRLATDEELFKFAAEKGWGK